MANTLRAARDELRLLLGTTGVRVETVVPGRVTPPVAVIEPGTPYMEQGETFDDFAVRFNVVLFAASADNLESTDQLDQLVCDVIDAVDTWVVEGVDQPSAFDVNGSLFLGTRIALLCDKDLQT